MNFTKLEHDLIAWANPNFDPELRPTKAWALTSIWAIAYALVPYFLIVIVGIIRYNNRDKSLDGVKSPKPKTWDEVWQFFRREPLKILLVVYNAFQVGLCVWMVIFSIVGATERNFPLICTPYEPLRTEGIPSVLWVFYISKIIDFADTFFIVARGKWVQFSFLHVYHHISIYLVYWFMVNGGYDGDIYFTIVANGVVHALMYFYYFLTAFGSSPSWGAHLTKLQLIQFIAMMTHGTIVLLYPEDCIFPRPIAKFYVVYIFSLFVLFAKFYIDRWCSKRSQAKKGEKAEAKKDK
jgi:elongation of very long chain fatty acids protein 4